MMRRRLDGGAQERRRGLCRRLERGSSRHAARLAGVPILACGGFAAALALALPSGRASARPATTTSPVPATSVSGTTTDGIVWSTAPEVLAVSGHGWGHGMGLSQWGAYGYALHGFTADRILAHYYPGTSLGTAPGRTVRVLLAQGRRITLTSISPWRAVDSAGAKVKLAPGTLALGPAAKLEGKPMVPPVTFSAAAPLQVDGALYRGKVVVTRVARTMDAVNVVGLESYVKSVVPSEVPSNWPAAALQAQAIAARSYALANLRKGGHYDLYADTRDQVYDGIAAESAATSAAVDSTEGRVVLYDGEVADTLFFSTSGGRTASAADVIGTPIPYLVSVPDPYDTASPYHDWGPVLFDAAKVARRLKVGAPLADVSVTASASGRARAVTVTGADESQATFTGSQVRDALGLRSTWFTPSLYVLGPKTLAITYGGAASLTGIVKGAAAPSLEAKAYGKDWTAAGPLALGAGGSFSALVKPQTRTTYRLAAGAVRAGLATVLVAARVDATIESSGAEGSVRPLVPAAAVQLQRTDGTAWTTVGSVAADASGHFSVGGPLATGTYRVRFAPGGGLQPGLSASATVQ
jgi:SpoIID/LytB domain protein